MRYIVRPKLSGHERQFSGSEGSSGIVVFTETAAKAREQGAARLNRRQHEVEVIELGETVPVVSGPDRPLTQEEAAEIFNQETQIVPGSWEGV